MSKIKPKTWVEDEETKLSDYKSNSAECIDWDEKVTPTGRSMHKIMINTNFDSESEEILNKKLNISNEELIEWDDERWQVKVLKPYWDCINSTSYEKDQMQIIKHLKIIVDKSFSKLNKEGWKTILTSLWSLNFSKFTTDVFVLCYELLQTIVFEHIELVHSSNVQIVVENIKRFATYHQGIYDYNKIEANSDIWWNSSRLFCKVAKYLESALENKDQNEHNPTSSDQNEVDVEILWKILFNEIKCLYAEAQYSNIIRKSTLQAVEQIMNHYSSLMAWEQWEYALENTILSIFEKSVTRYIEQLGGFSTTKAREIKQREAVPAMQTPTFSFSQGNPTAGKKINKKGEGRKMKFDEESIQKFHQRNMQETPSQNEFVGFGLPPDDNKISKQSVLNVEDQNLSLTSMKIFNNVLDSYNKTFIASGTRSGKAAIDFWITYSKYMSPFINNASAEILKGVLQTINFVLDSSLVEYFYQKYDSVSLGVFEDINNVIQRKTDLVLSTEATDLIVKIFKQIFTKKNVESKPQILNPQSLNVVLHILRIILMNARPTIGLNVMRQDNDLKDDEKLIFDFIEYLGELVHKYDDPLKYYLSFLLNFISYDASEPHYEMFVRKTLLIISNGIWKDHYSPSILYDLIPELFIKTCNIVDLRYHNDSWMSLVFSMKSSTSLFETAGTFLLQITSHILDKDIEEQNTKDSEPPKLGMKKLSLQIEIPDDSKDQDEIDQENIDEKNSDEEISTNSDSLRKKAMAKGVVANLSTSLRAIDEEDSLIMSPSKFRSTDITVQSVHDMILSKIMEILKETLLFDIAKIEKHNKAVKDAVIKSSQDLDVQVINFIINALLPHAYKLGKKFEHTLVSIIDKGWNGYLDAMSTSGLNIFGSSSTVLAKSNSYSTYWFDNLFELWSYKQNRAFKSPNLMKPSKKEKLEEIRRKIAKTTTPILLDRCKDTLNRFLYDEMKSGSIMMSQQRAEEVVFILEKLKNLEVYPELLNEIVQEDTSKLQSSEVLSLFYDCLINIG